MLEKVLVISLLFNRILVGHIPQSTLQSLRDRVWVFNCVLICVSINNAWLLQNERRGSGTHYSTFDGRYDMTWYLAASIRFFYCWSAVSQTTKVRDNNVEIFRKISLSVDTRILMEQCARLLQTLPFSFITLFQIAIFSKHAHLAPRSQSCSFPAYRPSCKSANSSFVAGLTYPLSNIFYPNLFFDLSSSRAVEVFRPQVRKEGRAPLGAFDPIL